MEYRGSFAYEEQEFLYNYLKRRSRPDSPNNAIEEPITNRLLGNLENKHILDLGCGDGQYGKEIIKKGATAYTGVEGSSLMIDLARRNLAGTDAALINSSMENFDFPANEYDIVVSRMALHYIEDVNSLFGLIYNAMKDGAKFLFSVQHPLTTASFKSKSGGERRSDWIVDDYFEQGARQEPWIGKTVIKYHRTIEFYFTALTAARFRIEALEEGNPERANFVEEEEYERRKRIPIILVFSCLKG
ncbi:class I SAM-dependent methyltransferase [Planococcus sp. MERTA32b]|nr:class I SAM-dependent methyltransferase [Planococcus sp. MER TA 32b]